MWTPRCGQVASGDARGVVGIPEEDEELMEWEEDDEQEEDEEHEAAGADEDMEATMEARRRVEEIFERQVMLADAGEAARQVAAGVCVRVVLPVSLFGRADVELT